MDTGVLSQFPAFNLVIPAWQMALYIAIISLCMLTYRDKLALLVTYIFTLYWAFFVLWGEALENLGTFPVEATWYIILGSLHVILTLIAFFRES